MFSRLNAPRADANSCMRTQRVVSACDSVPRIGWYAAGFGGPASFPHFRLLGLCAAGRDEGSFRFEAELVEQIAFYMRLFQEAARLGYYAHKFRIAITDLEDGQRTQALEEQVWRIGSELP